jgi:hypothetical protein
MRGKIGAAFIAGVISCVLILGAVIGTFHVLGADAEAQSTRGETWQIKAFPMSTVGDASWSEFGVWVRDMPAACDVETVVVPATVTTGSGSSRKNLTDASILAYYRCPDA